jgi:hypothetical protein
MPAESDAQRKFLYATKGAAWVKAHHFDNKGPLPAKVGKKSTKHSSKRRKMMDSFVRKNG